MYFIIDVMDSKTMKDMSKLQRSVFWSIKSSAFFPRCSCYISSTQVFTMLSVHCSISTLTYKDNREVSSANNAVSPQLCCNIIHVRSAWYRAKDRIL
jgi:hypothetical protein